MIPVVRLVSQADKIEKKKDPADYFINQSDKTENKELKIFEGGFNAKMMTEARKSLGQKRQISPAEFAKLHGGKTQLPNDNRVYSKDAKGKWVPIDLKKHRKNGAGDDDDSAQFYRRHPQDIKHPRASLP